MSAGSPARKQTHERHRNTGGRPPVPARAGAGAAEIAATIERARAAQRTLLAGGQHRLDTAAQAVAWAIMEPGRNRALAELAVADTGLGNVPDKVRKNHRKTLGLMRDLHGVPTTGVISRDPVRGLIEIARPVGVVAAVTPSTNPPRRRPTRSSTR